MEIQSLNIGRPQLVGPPGQVMKSGMRKRPVLSAHLYTSGFEQDDVADKVNHGGNERAVCFYPLEHYPIWNELAGRELATPAFGENITLTGMTEEKVCIGDIYSIGETRVQISQSRIPCAKIDIFNQVRGLLKQFVGTGKTGYLAKVVEEGLIRSDDEIHLISRPKLTISIADLNDLYFHDRKNKEKIEEVLQIKEIAADLRNDLEKLLNAAART